MLLFSICSYLSTFRHNVNFFRVKQFLHCLALKIKEDPSISKYVYQLIRRKILEESSDICDVRDGNEFYSCNSSKQPRYEGEYRKL